MEDPVLADKKTLLEGYFDRYGAEFHFLVTGSARLELFHQAGDSMLGRYHILHLNPLTPSEVAGKKPSPNEKLVLERYSCNKEN